MQSLYRRIHEVLRRQPRKADRDGATAGMRHAVVLGCVLASMAFTARAQCIGVTCGFNYNNDLEGPDTGTDTRLYSIRFRATPIAHGMIGRKKSPRAGWILSVRIFAGQR